MCLRVYQWYLPMCSLSAAGTGSSVDVLHMRRLQAPHHCHPPPPGGRCSRARFGRALYVCMGVDRALSVCVIYYNIVSMC